MTITNSHVTVNVKDLDKSVAFYESIGLSVTGKWGNFYAQVTAPGITIGLHPSQHLPGNSGNTSIGFFIGNLDDAKSLTEKLAISTTYRKEEGGEFLLFNDLDGTALYFYKPNW
jgi:catechol 2,3-dioxygenase-like lactoylglutathione lyase family enzyme